MRVGAVRSPEPAERAARQRERPCELQGASPEALVIALAGVRGARVHVELIRIQGPPKQIERQLGPAHAALGVQSDQVARRGEVIARGEIRVRPRVHDVVGKASCLMDLVLRATVAQGRVPTARDQAELPEEGADAARGRLAPAGLVLVAGADVVVPIAVSIAGLELHLVPAVTSPGHLHFARSRRRPPARHEIDGRAE